MELTVDNLTLDNTLLVLEAFGVIALNFWPCIVFAVGYCIWETMVMQNTTSRVRLKSKNANYPYRGE